jgi:hypothetical protein
MRQDNGYTAKEVQEVFNSERFDVKNFKGYVRNKATGEVNIVANVTLDKEGKRFFFEYEMTEDRPEDIVEA